MMTPLFYGPRSSWNASQDIVSYPSPGVDSSGGQHNPMIKSHHHVVPTTISQRITSWPTLLPTFFCPAASAGIENAKMHQSNISAQMLVCTTRTAHTVTSCSDHESRWH